MTDMVDTQETEETIEERPKTTLEVIREQAGILKAKEGDEPETEETEPQESTESEDSEPVQPVAPTKDQVVKAKPVEDDDEPVILPARLKAEQKEAILKLSKAEQKIVAETVKDLERGYSQLAQKATTTNKFYEGLDRVVSPHVADLQRRNIKPADVIDRALKYDSDMVRDPVGTLLRLAQSNNAIDGIKQALGVAHTGNGQQQPNAQSQQQQQYYDPRYDSLEQKVNGVVSQYEQRQMQAQLEAANAATAAWKTEKDEHGLDAHPYLEHLIPEMGPVLEEMEAANPRLAQQDPAALLDFAYNHALKAHPELRGAITKKRDLAAKKKQLADTKARTDKARSATVSIKGGLGSDTDEVDFKNTKAILQALSSGRLKPV
jgi:hypothetical protein